MLVKHLKNLVQQEIKRKEGKKLFLTLSQGKKRRIQVGQDR